MPSGEQERVVNTYESVAVHEITPPSFLALAPTPGYRGVAAASSNQVSRLLSIVVN